MTWPPNNEEILAAIQNLFQRGQWWVYKGEVAQAFEHRFAEAHDCQFGVSVCKWDDWT